MTGLTLIDLFAGCGGMTRGFADAGFIPSAAVEFDEAAASTYAANFGPEVTRFGDVAEFEPDEAVDVVIGGPPCQGFSNLGRRAADDARNVLWRQFVRVVKAAQAPVFVLENVDRFGASTEFEQLRRETRPGGALHGYTISRLSLLATNFGVPQKRIRTIIIGSRIGLMAALEPTNYEQPKDGQLPWRTVRDAISDLAFDGLPTALPDGISVNYFGRPIAGAFKLQDIHVGRNYRDISITRYDLIPPGKSRMVLPEHLLYECWKRHTTGARDVLGRMQWDRPSLTIRTEFFKPEKGAYLHPQWDETGQRINRAITHAEAARLQGFDDRHLWCGSKIDIARQIGNAVPPPLARAIAESVKATFSASA